MLFEERLRSVKQANSRTSKNASADRFMRGAHHRRCAREGLTAPMMPYGAVCCKRQNCWVRLQWRRRTSRLAKVWYSPLQHYQFFKPLSTSGFACSVLLLVPSVCFSNLTMPGILMHGSTNYISEHTTISERTRFIFAVRFGLLACS